MWLLLKYKEKSTFGQLMEKANIASKALALNFKLTSNVMFKENSELKETK
jgi:hypothetical protein